MTFNPNIPQANDDPTASQSDLLGNFGKLNTDWAVNHIPLTSGGNNGFHKFIQFPTVLSVDPTVTGQQSAVYPKSSGGSPALFFKNASSVFQLTNLPVTTSGTNYGIVTPWGFTINAGSIPSGSLTPTVTFAIPFTNGVVYTAEITAQQGSSLTNYSITSLITSGMAVTGLNLSTQVASGFYYLAIGR